MTESIPSSLLVLWDIDGTLLYPIGGGNVEYERAVLAIHPEVDLTEVQTQGKTDRQVVHEYLQAAGKRVEDAPRVLEHLDELSAHYESAERRIPVLAGVPETLRRVQAHGYVNGLLTGNTRTRALRKLRGAGLALELIAWEQSFFGADSPTRGDVTRRARERYPDRPMVIIGDTPLDGAAAAQAGLPFIAVSTGHYGAAELEAAGAAIVIDDLVSGADRLDVALRGVAG